MFYIFALIIYYYIVDNVLPSFLFHYVTNNQNQTPSYRFFSNSYSKNEKLRRNQTQKKLRPEEGRTNKSIENTNN